MLTRGVLERDDVFLGRNLSSHCRRGISGGLKAISGGQQMFFKFFQGANAFEKKMLRLNSRTFASLGRVSMSQFEKDTFVNYERIQKNLDIVKDRYILN